MMPMTYIIVGMILLVAGGFMIFAMVVLNSIKSVHGRQNQASASRTHSVLLIIHWAIRVLMIFLSSLVAAYESYQKLLHPEPLRYVWWVMAAALVGFVGNEGVAILRIRIGRQIGSAALVADGQHARVDGWTSLAVLLGAVGSLLGFPLADPIIGILITLVILFIVKDSAVTMWHRLMDAVDPQQVEAVEREARAIPGVYDVHKVRLRWIGHTLYTELHITIDEDLSTWESHQIAEQVRHALFDTQPKLATVMVHVDPCGHGGTDPHTRASHHTPASPLSRNKMNTPR